MKKKAVLLIILIAFVSFFTSCNSVPNAVFGDIAITEVCSSNRTSLVLSDGTAPDWVEIKNVSNHEVSLNGCGLTDNVKKPYKYRFNS